MRFSTRVRVAATSATTTAAALVNLTLRGRARRTPAPALLAPGDPAPDFVLPASDGKTYRLSDYRGDRMVVLFWFPKAFTAGCARQCESLARHHQPLRRTGAAIFGANLDSPQVNRQFAEALGLEFPILSDEDGTTARAYDVLGAAGLPARRTFYIGRDGRILSIDSNVRVSSNGSDIEETLTQLLGPAA